jgi:phosphatidylinositol alpha-1,6-mannosyltransferase
MYFGIDTTLFRPGYAEAAQTWRQALAIPPNARVLFSVRAWRPLYRHELILEAFARAKVRLPFPAVLVFKKYNEVAGSLEGAIYEEQIRARAETLGVHHDLRWLDSVPYEQLPALYSLSDLVVNFARVDGFPVSFIEAAACGKRVISNRLPPYGEAGLEHFCSMVPDGDVGQLAKGLVELLLERPERAAGKADLARKWGETQGDENRCIEKLMAVYNGLARQGEDRAGGEERSGR